MKSLRLILFMLALAAGIDQASAQFSINKVTPKEADTKAIQDTLSKQIDLTNSFFSQSRYQAERRRIRKERNTVNFNGSLQMTQSGFNTNWQNAAGGQGNFTGRAAISFSHTYIRNKFNFQYTLEARYGFNILQSEALNENERQLLKTEDMFRLNINPSWALNKNWSYAALLQFASQFTKSYKTRADEFPASDFMSPGTLTLGLGFTYRHQKIPLTINISPLTGSMTFVKDSLLRAAYSVDPDRTQKSALGSSLILDMKVPFSKERISYKTYLDVFTNYDKVTRITWDNGLDFKILKFMTLNLFCTTKYDHSINLNKVDTEENGDLVWKRGIQFSHVLGVGLTYVFKNK